MQPDGIWKLNYFFHNAFAKFRMCYHIIDLKFDFAVPGTLVSLFPAVSVTNLNRFIVNWIF